MITDIASTQRGMMPLVWQYSRNQRRHYNHNGDWKNNHVRFEIKDCAAYRTIHRPEDGYDLYHWGKKVGHAKTVKALKLKAEGLV